MDSIMSNGTWVLVDLLIGSKAIQSKRAFRSKDRADGSIRTYKEIVS